MGCISNFKFPFENNTLDFDDAFVRKDIFTDGGLWVWGYGQRGLLGNNNSINQSSPIQTLSGGTNWKEVSTGDQAAGGVKTDGTLWMWGGALNSGQLGDNSSIFSKSSPVQTVSGGTNWKTLSVGCQHAAAIKIDGTLWIWGFGTGGLLGDNTSTSKSSPVQTISVSNNWKYVDLGAGISSAIKTDGTLWLWGLGDGGILGNNSTIAQSSPVQTVSATTDWKQVSSGKSHSAGVKENGTLWLWGSNASGQLGNNTTVSHSSPVQTVSATTDWKQIAVTKNVSVGNGHTAAIKTDGTLWLWGCSTVGQLGNNSVSAFGQSSPIQTISGGTNWKSVKVFGIATQGSNTTAIKTDGTLWTWGSGTNGKLGNNTSTGVSSPIQTISGGDNWVWVSTGGPTVAAIQESCW